ncbi:MAG: PKD domain-containing protein [Methanospirillum sp.]|nr:PKD domain-containing protein [Methanospirillum sp.]
MKFIEKGKSKVNRRNISLFRQILPVILFLVLLSGIGVTADIIPGFTGVPVEGSAPLTVSFVDQSMSSDNITGYAWNFGDGSSSATEKNPSHTYLGAGKYNVSLTVTDENDVSNTTMKESYISALPSEYPVVRFTVTPRNATTSQTVVFLDQSELDPAVPDEMYNYIWDFGDGNTDSSNARNIQHTYADAGNYQVKLRIQDQNGALYNAPGQEIITVSNGTSSFSALFTAIPETGPAPLAVSFIDQSTGPVAITGYAWDFGDGSSNATEKNPSHTYMGAGEYNVSLTITDENGAETTLVKESCIYARPSDYPVVKFTAVPRTINAGEEVYFIDQSELDPAVPDEMYNYLWDFGDNSTSFSSSGRNTEHTYTAGGDYTVSLQVQDQYGAEFTSPEPVTIHVVSGDSPVITATASLGGSISPSGAVSVPYGSDQTFRITPDTGYIIEDVLVDSKSAGAVSSYTFTDVTSDHTISASFISGSSHTITASAGSGGSISPSGAVSVPDGESQTFTITPNSGYKILDVLVDSKNVGAVSSYTFSDVTSDHTISASFGSSSSLKHTIMAQAGRGGSISPSGSVSVPDGGSKTFTITPYYGYAIANVVIDGSLKGALSSYTFQNVDTDRTIYAAFNKKYGSSSASSEDETDTSE